MHTSLKTVFFCIFHRMSFFAWTYPANDVWHDVAKALEVGDVDVLIGDALHDVIIDGRAHSNADDCWVVLRF